MQNITVSSKLRCKSHDKHKLKFSIEPFNEKKVNVCIVFEFRMAEMRKFTVEHTSR